VFRLQDLYIWLFAVAGMAAYAVLFAAIAKKRRKLAVTRLVAVVAPILILAAISYFAYSSKFDLDKWVNGHIFK
jgi:bacteriorhodopsin